jgi:hypothetical protein
MQSFGLKVGQTRRIQANPVDDLNQPQPINGNVSYASSDATLGTATPNAGAAGQTQVDVKGLAVGTITVTASAQDTQSPSVTFSTPFQVVITAADVVPHASAFDFVDQGLI